jgi:tRNA pseudouridine13 synthase
MVMTTMKMTTMNRFSKPTGNKPITTSPTEQNLPPALGDAFPSPLPQRFLSADDVAPIGGRIKERPDDFLVDEISLYEPSGEGEHLYLRIQKNGVSHAEMIACVRRTFRVPERAIGYAGMKDKQGVTQQTVSVHLPHDHSTPESVDLGHDRLHVLWTDRHTNKLRLGHLRGNRFAIRLRDIEPARVVTVRNRLDRLEAHGVPNYFGSQRFGYRVNNHVLGFQLLRGDWEGAARELLGVTSTPFPERQRERRELFDAGAVREAARQWSPADRNELMLIRHLADGASAHQAFRKIGRKPVTFWINAFQSAVFNRVLDDRLASGTLDELHLGDLAWVHSKHAVFPVTEAELQTGELAGRLKDLELSPSGPIWGRGMTQTTDGVQATESAALRAFGLSPEELGEGVLAPKGERRPLRILLTNRAVESGVDEHGPYIRVAFDLTRGSYATVAMREITQSVDDIDSDTD